MASSGAAPSSGSHPPRVLEPAAGRHPRPRPDRDPVDQQARPRGRRLRGHRGAAAFVPARRLAAGHRRGRPHNRIREGLPDPPGQRDGRVAARPADPRRPSAGRARPRPGPRGADRLRPLGHRQHRPLRPQADRGGPIHAIIGGFHLGGPLFEHIIAPDLRRPGGVLARLPRPCHCTGWRAIHALAARFPDAFIQNSVGTRFEFAAAG